MANDKVSVVFEALVGSTTKSTFQTLTKGFQDFAKGLRQSAKELSKMQQSQAADALGHVAMQVEKLSGSLSKMGQGTSKAKTQLQSLENSFKTLLGAENKNAEAAKQVMETYKKGGMTYQAAAKELNRLNTSAKIAAQSEQFLANETALVNQKWKQMIPVIQNGNISFNKAVGTTKNFGAAIENLRQAVKQGGGNLSEFDKKLEQVNVDNIKMANGIKLAGSSFKIYNKQGYETIGLTRRNAEAVRMHTQSLTTYQKIINRTGQEQTKLREALTKVGNSFKTNQMRMDAYAKNLYKSEQAINALSGGLKQNSAVSAKALQNIDRMSIATQAEAQNLRITANGFKILNNQGLKPFGNLSLEAAGKLKMLGAGFETLVAKERELATRTGKTTAEMRAKTTAMWEAGNSIKQINAAHQKEIAALSKSATETDKLKQKASLLKQTYAESLKPLNALNKSQQQSQRRMKLWLSQMSKGKGDLNALNVAIRKEVKSFQEQSKAIEASKSKAKELKKDFGSLLKTTDNLTASQKRSVDRMRGWVNVLEKGKGNASVLGKQVKQAAASFNAEAKAIKQNSAAHAKNVDGARQLSTQYKSLVGSARMVTQSSKGMTDAQRRLKIQAVNLIREVKKGNRTFGYAKTKLQELKKQFQDAAPEASRFERAISKLANSLKTYGSYMISSQVLMGMSNAFRAGTQAIIEHDQALHNLKAIMNATDTEVRTLDDTMLSVAQSTKFSIGEVGQAMVRFGQAGFTAAEAMAGMNDVASLATGTLESLEETVNLVATGVRVFRLEMDQTGKVADVFANAVNNSRLTLHKLNIAFNYIGPLAKAAGLSLKDTTASLQLLANAGVRASTTGTGLRRVISGLLNPSTALAESIKNAGYQVDDFNPLLHDFSTIIGRLPDVVNNAGDAVEMFGLRGSAVVSAFATQGVSEFNRLRLGLNETGAASRMAEEQMKGLQNMIKNVSDKFGVFASTLVKGGILSGIKALINLVRGTLAALTALVDNGIARVIITLGSLSLAFMGVAGTIRALLKLNILQFFTQASAGVVAFIGNLMQLDIAAATSSAQVTKLSDALYILRQGFKKAGAAALVFAKNPIGLAITAIGVAIGGTIAALTAYEKHLKSVQEEQNNLAGGLNTTLSSFENFQEMVKEYGVGSKEATDAALTLRRSAEKLGEEHEELSDTTDKLTDAIHEETGVLLKNEGAIIRQSTALRVEYLKAATEATNASAKLYEKQRWVAGIFDKLTWFAKEFGQKLIDGLLMPLRLVRDAVIGFSKGLWWLSGLIPGFEKMSKRMIDALGGIDDALTIGINSIDEAKKAWDDLKKKMEEGDATDKEAERFKEISKNAERTAKAIDDMGMSLAEWKKTNEGDLGHLDIVAVTEAFRELKRESSGVGESIEKQFGYITNELQKDVTDATKEGIDSIERMRQLFGDYANKVTHQAYIMYQAETDLYKRQAGEYEKLKDNQSQADSRYLERLKKIYLQMHSSYKNVLDKQKAYLQKTYSVELANLSAHFDNRKNLIDSNYEREREAAEASLQSELRAIQQKNLTEMQLESELWNAKDKYFSSHLQAANRHTDELIRLADERFDAEMDKAKSLAKSEEDLKKTVVDLEQEKYEAKTESLEELEDEYTDYISTLKEKEESLTDKIESELDKRKSFNESIQEKIQNLYYKTLTDTEKIEAKKSHAVEQESKARQAYLAGETKATKENTEKAIEAWEDYASALDEDDADYAYKLKKVQDALRDLGMMWNQASKDDVKAAKDTREKVNKELDAQEKKLTELQDRIEEFNKKMVEMGSKIDMQGAINELDRFSNKFDEKMKDKQVAIEFVNNLSELSIEDQIKLLGEEIDKEFNDRKTTEITFKDDKNRSLESAIKSYIKQMEELAEDREMTLKINQVGDSAPGHQTGGFIPGYGGGDQVPANLEKGEFIIRKEMVKKYGRDLFQKLNQGIIDPVRQKFSKGGGVPQTQNKIKGFSAGGFISKEIMRGFDKASASISAQSVLQPAGGSFGDMQDFGRLTLDIGGKEVETFVQKDSINDLNNQIANMKRFSS